MKTKLLTVISAAMLLAACGTTGEHHEDRYHAEARQEAAIFTAPFIIAWGPQEEWTRQQRAVYAAKLVEWYERKMDQLEAERRADQRAWIISGR